MPCNMHTYRRNQCPLEEFLRRRFEPPLLGKRHTEAVCNNYSLLVIKIIKIPRNPAPSTVELSRTTRSLTRGNKKNFGNHSRQAPSADYMAESVFFFFPAEIQLVC